MVGGDRLRIYKICEALSATCDLTLLSLCDSRRELRQPIPSDGVFREVHRVYLSPWRSRLNALLALASRTPMQVAYYRSRRFARLVAKHVAEHDIALAHLIRTEPYLRGAAIPTIVELTDAISLNYLRSAGVLGLRGVRPVVYAVERKRLLRAERSALSRHSALGLISTVDANYLFGEPRPEDVVVYGNGVDMPKIALARYMSPPYDIAFIGNMSTLQNLDAVKWFASQVLPLLREHGAFQLRVIGRIGAQERKYLESIEGVRVTGEVASVAEAASGCFAAVCPMRIGAGIQNKVLEYLALGLPTVTSTVGAEGLNAESGKHLLVADAPEAVVQHLLEIWADPELAAMLSNGGRTLVQGSYSWDVQLRPLVRTVERLLASRPSSDKAR